MSLPTRCLATTLAAALLSACSAGASGPAEHADDRGSESSESSESTSTVVVRLGDLKLEYTLDASTEAGAHVELGPNGRLRFVPALAADESRRVRSGQRIGRLAVARSALDALQAASGTSAAEVVNLRAQERDVLAPIEGTLHVDGRKATVRAPGIDVVASLSPIQYLRFLSMPFSGTAHVETVLGPVTVPCDAVWSVPSADASNDSAAALHCRLPPYVETAPGLRATVTIESAPVQDSLLVPNLFIGYDARRDQYFVEVLGESSAQRVDVEAGPSDGVVRVVDGDIKAGDRLSRPVPGARQS